MATFDVLRQPWIPVVEKSGGTEELGIIPLLVRAHELSAIEDPSPVVQFGLHRVLIAFVMDAYGLKTEADWLALWEQGYFDEGRLEQYIIQCGNRFNLFDNERPFMQSSVDPAAEKKEKMISTLMPELASGNNFTHFDHVADAHRVSPAVAARAICAVADFCTAGLQGPSSVNGAPPWYVLLRGRSLFETMLFNCYVGQLPEHINREAAPPWRRGEGLVSNKVVDKVGFLEGLVFQPRYLRLLPDDEGGVCTVSGKRCETLVSRLYYAAGFNLQDIGRWQDPHAAYLITEKGISTLKPKQGKAAWRDMGALLLLKSEQDSSKRLYMRPCIINQYEKFSSSERIFRREEMLVDIYGLFTDQAKVKEWQFERMSVPLRLLGLPNGIELVRQMLELAERTEGALLRAVNKLLPQKIGKTGQESKRKDKDDVFAVAARTLYWSGMEKKFKALLPEIAAEGERGDLVSHWLAKWKIVLRDEARSVLQKTKNQIVSDYSWEVAADNTLHVELLKVLYPKG